ncbi:MAG TPA: hypothetical protein VFF52_20110 [Isosphaeraceae bacterium]|nr:hypothetical protein [Isosphaeraceae bacterium]
MAQDEAWPDRLIEAARRGDDAARGTLLELYRNYLRLVARSLIGGALRIKLDPSDLVQETFLKAHRDIDEFAGGTERKLERLTVVLRTVKALSPRTPPVPPLVRGGEWRRAGPELFPPDQRQLEFPADVN